jgi:hypothetical protein
MSTFGNPGQDDDYMETIRELMSSKSEGRFGKAAQVFRLVNVGHVHGVINVLA